MSTSIERLIDILDDKAKAKASLSSHVLGKMKRAEEALGEGALSRPSHNANFVSAPRWSRDQLSGRLTEISGSGAAAPLTAAVGLILDAQRAGEPSAWITLPESCFYPPDVADSGVDLASLIVVRVPDTRLAARAAERLVRSGAFGLVIIDLGYRLRAGSRERAPQAAQEPQGGAIRPSRAPFRTKSRAADILSAGLQGRLVSLAQRHDAAVVCLTDKGRDVPSLGSLVSLRVEALRERDEPGTFRCRLQVLKDKRRGPGWSHTEIVRGPAGLR